MGWFYFNGNNLCHTDTSKTNFGHCSFKVIPYVIAKLHFPSPLSFYWQSDKRKLYWHDNSPNNPPVPVHTHRYQWLGFRMAAVQEFNVIECLLQLYHLFSGHKFLNEKEKPENEYI